MILEIRREYQEAIVDIKKDIADTKKDIADTKKDITLILEILTEIRTKSSKENTRHSH